MKANRERVFSSIRAIFLVTMVTDDRSRLLDLGELEWYEVNPDKLPIPERFLLLSGGFLSFRQELRNVQRDGPGR
jgi:hypothetical protein